MALPCIGAYAAIAPGTTLPAPYASYSGNGELFISVFDAEAKVSYTKDLGITQDEFFVSGQQDSGSHFYWGWNQNTDPQWAAFLGQVNQTNLRWAVMAFDFIGGTGVGKIRTYTTIKQGDEALLEPSDGSITFTNQVFQLGAGPGQAGQFFNAVNTTGTHGSTGSTLDYAINGSSVNLESDSGKSYFGESGGLTPTLNNNAPFDVSNAVGESSWFYYVTRSGTDQLAQVLVDEFDNVAPGSAGDAYFGFIYVDPLLYPTSPYAGQWLLSYTLDAAPGFSAAQRAFAATIGRTEFTGSFTVHSLTGTAVAAAGANVDVVRRLSGVAVAPAALAVPEPTSSALLAAGLLIVAAGVARKRR